MILSFKPSLDPEVAAEELKRLVACRIDPVPFQLPIQRLERICAAYAAHAPFPHPAPGLVLTTEDHYQSELWLPLSAITPVFLRFYRAALKYPPIFSSTPFASATSWAGIVAALPVGLHMLSPALLLQNLLVDSELRIQFLFHSFMPQRFYGFGDRRYPQQSAFIKDHLRKLGGKVKALDAACGDGSGCYTLARMLLEQGKSRDMFRIEGWTLDPLECWSAAHGSFPHTPQKSALYREMLSIVRAEGADSSIMFSRIDLLDMPDKSGSFDLILCNGLLGGPIINDRQMLGMLIEKFGNLLGPDGILLVADNFHGGWKKKCPQEELQALFKRNNFDCFDAGEGLGFVKS